MPKFYDADADYELIRDYAGLGSEADAGYASVSSATGEGARIYLVR